MTETRAHRPSVLRLPWVVPAVVAVAVAGAFAVPQLASAGDAGLPDITPEELAVRAAESVPVPLSGTVVYTARLGLPEIPFTEAAGADPIALLGGSSMLRVWSDGTGRSRVALLGAASEYSVVRDGADAWTYSSTDDEVVHYGLDDADQARYEEGAAQLRSGIAPELAGDLPTPEEAGREALAHAEEFSTVSLDAQTTVAGRGAYQLVITPRSTETLVARVVVAIDAETLTPLRVQAWSTQDATAPSLELGFTDVTFAMPEDSVLAFSEPAGADSREVVVPLPEPGEQPSAATDPSELPDGVSVTGTGWESVTEWSGLDVAALVAGDPAALDGLPGSGRIIGSQDAEELVGEFLGEDGSGGPQLDQSALYDQLTTAVPEGRLLSSTLLSVLVTTDGRVLVGAVPAETLRGMA